jgi:UDPglucose 6-dehydrogenase
MDVNQKAVDLINAGRAPVVEPLLQETISAGLGRLRATNDYEDAVCNSDMTLILVPTPSQPDGGFSLEFVRAAAKEIARVLAHKQAYHVVTLVSTVLPGDCESQVIPLLEEHSGKRCGPDFGFCYGPEFIALGSVIDDFLHPDFVLIGEYDGRSGDKLSDMYRRSCENEPSIARMNIVNAEITKISVNTYVTTKITFANMLTELCSQLPGANVDVVTDAMGRDSRIGRRYLTGAVSFGGPCFPRDNVAFAHLAHSLGVDAGLAEATHAYNESLKLWLLDRVLRASADPGTLISIIGLAYRPGTPVLEKATGMWLADTLAGLGKRLILFDDIAMLQARERLGAGVEYAADLHSAVSDARVVVLIAGDETVCNLRPTDFPQPTVTVIDCWRSCTWMETNPSIDYAPLGTGAMPPIFQPADSLA